MFYTRDNIKAHIWKVGERKEFNLDTRRVNIITKTIEEARQKAHLEGEGMLIQDREILRMYVDACIRNDEYVLDVETTGLDTLGDIIVGVCIYTPNEIPAYIPMFHTDLEGKILPNQIPYQQAVHEINRLTASNAKHINHNTKFDHSMLITNFKQGINNIYWDTQLAGKVLNENEKEHGLKYLYARYVAKTKDMQKFKELFKDVPFNFIPLDVAKIYGANDGLKTYKLYEFQKYYLNPKTQFRKIHKLFSELEMPLIPVLADMELRGVQIRDDYTEQLRDELGETREEAYKELLKIETKYKDKIMQHEEIYPLIEKAKGDMQYRINYNSPKQLQGLIYDILKFPSVDRRNPRGTGKEIQEKWAGRKLTKVQQYFLENFQVYKKMDKLITSFVDKLPKSLASDGKIHTNFNQYGAKCITGDSLIPTPEGIFTIQYMCDNNQEGQLVPREHTIVNRYKQLEKSTHVVKYTNVPTIRLNLGYGLTIEGTPHHPIIRDGEFTQLQDIQVGETINVPLGYNIFNTEYQPLGISLVPSKTHNTKKVTMPTLLDEDFAEFLGMYFADGSVHDSNGSWGVRISNKNPEVIARAKELIKVLFNIDAQVQQSNTTLATTFSCIQLQELNKYLQRGANNKIVPNELYKSPKAVICAFIRGLTLDSSFDKNRERLSISQVNSNNMRFIQQSLLNIGIKCGQSKTRLRITRDDYQIFLKEVGVIESSKRHIRPVKKYKTEFKVKVQSIEQKVNTVYDFHVPITHSFISNGIISHNTGRFSSSDPIHRINLQQIPSRGKGSAVRKMFTAREGYVLIGSDYSAIEPRVLAKLCQDKEMIQAYTDGVDLYSVIASRIFKKPYEECMEFHPITGEEQKEGKERRSAVKSVLLGIMYGRSPQAIANQFHKPKKWAEQIIANFYEHYPNVKKLQVKAEYLAYKYGFVETILGRKRRLPEMSKTVLHSPMYAYWARRCLNAMVQGSSADIMKSAMLNLSRDAEWQSLDAHMLLTIHDELICEVKAEDALKASQALSRVMKATGEKLINMPMKCDVEITKVWYGEDITEYLEERYN